MNARDRILNRLRQAPSQPLPAPDFTAGRPQLPAAAMQAHYLQSLQKNLETAHAEVHQTDGENWRQKLAEICRDKGIGTLMLPPSGVELPAWTGGPELRRFETALEQHKDALFRDIDAGLTVADCAIADTGMLVLLSSPAQPRSLSLVPPIHVCLLDADRLHADLPSALASGDWAAAMPTNLIFISGPSKTADIQQTLAYGAHGPKQLIVIVIHRSAA